MLLIEYFSKQRLRARGPFFRRARRAAVSQAAHRAISISDYGRVTTGVKALYGNSPLSLMKSAVTFLLPSMVTVR